MIDDAKIASIKSQLAGFDEWSTDRADLAERDGMLGEAVSSSDWHDSDDSGIEYARTFAESTRELLEALGQPRTIWTLTVEDSAKTSTLVVPTEADCVQALRLNYDAGGEYEHVPDDEIIQSLIDMQGLIIYIESHQI